ncbi:hypothetical protein N7462_008146 [Penicillium macrosclerotiorum]|uniref:uncharacterized protein n=1 Tax=Penicillium macrosclerotiorum TaxID=303699 RepID=UPI00254697D0|nr:uncharacterized protein N7462_008146 [Penicillium macrosclerotiorum]KAJ5679902.1 hypothetical protein N7462_008146 [Penicillium macrosclerotiorum]
MKAYERAKWDKIRAEFLLQMGPWKEVKTNPALDEAVERLTEVTISAVENHTPNRRPNPYYKWWFTPALKAQQTTSVGNGKRVARSTDVIIQGLKTSLKRRKKNAESGPVPLKRPKGHTGNSSWTEWEKENCGRLPRT